MTTKLMVQVVKRAVNSPDVVTIFFTVDGRPVRHLAGQYITVYFDDTDVKQGKAYSFSSCPDDEFSSITVKKIGLFSGKLHALKVGDSFTISQPYGFFHAHSGQSITAIAAGVGIAPIWSIIRHEVGRGTGAPIKLLYTNKTCDDIIFRSAIDELNGNFDNFSSQYFVTRQPDALYTTRRIAAQQDIGDISEDQRFYICGSQDFVKSIWQQLREVGVGEDSISTETFFETRV